MSESDATMVVDAGQAPPADSQLQPTDSSIVNQESAVASGGASTPLDAQPTALVENDPVDTVTATSTGGLVGELPQTSPGDVAEREEGECSTSSGEAGALDATNGLPQDTRYTAFHPEPDNFFRMFHGKLDNAAASSVEILSADLSAASTDMDWEAPGAVNEGGSRGERLDIPTEPLVISTSTNMDWEAPGAVDGSGSRGERLEIPTESHVISTSTNMDWEAPGAVNGSCSRGERLDIPTEPHITDTSIGGATTFSAMPTALLGTEPPKGPAVSRATPNDIPMRTHLLETQKATAPSYSSVPAKRALSPPMIHDNTVANDVSKRPKTTLTIKSETEQDAMSDRPQLSNVQHITGANGTPVVARGHAGNEERGFANVSRPGLPNLAATHDVQAHNGPVRIKEEPQDEASHPFATRDSPGCGVNIMKFFNYELEHNPDARRALQVVQSKMDHFVLASGPLETFNLARAITQHMGITIGTKRRRTINRIHQQLYNLRGRRLMWSSTSQPPSQPASASPYQPPAQNRFEGAGKERSAFDSSLRRSARVMAQRVGSAQISPHVDEPRALNAQTQEPQQSQRGVQTFDTFQNPSSTTVVRNLEPAQVPPPISVFEGVPAQMQKPVHPDTDASSVNLPYHEGRGSTQGGPGATLGLLTVLTLPRLDINQSPEVQQICKTMLDEANSLLVHYSNVRLAFSAQDMGRR